MLKRTYSTSSSYVPAKRGKYPPKPRRIPRAPRTNIAIVKRCVYYDATLNVDLAAGFGFSPTNLWVNGASSTAITSASDMTNMYEFVRIKKVDMIITPYANVHEYTVDTVTTGARNIPIIYHCEDKSDSDVPNINSLLQEDTLKVDMLDKVIKRTIYPKYNMYASGGNFININRNAAWVLTGSDVPSFGIKMYVDTLVANTYSGLRVNFVITYECKDAK